MEEKPRIRYWIDPGLPDPLHTKEDVEDVMRRVEEIKARLLAEAIRKAALN
jgi:hypothetical protein